jgi:NADPH-dependent curcumin reductase CurA
MTGFIIGDFSAKFPAAMKQLALWLKEAKLTYSETIVERFENIPQAYIDLFDGKMIVTV